MSPQPFGEFQGERVWQIEIEAPDATRACILSWGAVVRELCVPAPGGGVQQLVLGLNTLDHYVQHSHNFGAIAGRYAGRIAHGRFRLDGRTHELPRNEANRHCLHGGTQGFSRRCWQLAHVERSSVTLTLVSAEGDCGFPGEVRVSCRYIVLEPRTLRIELAATTSEATPLNLAHHSYFNLDGSASILDHHLAIAADFYTPLDLENIPTGEIRAVSGTPFDFTRPRSLRWLDSTGRQMRYDTNFVLRRAGLHQHALVHAATLRAPRGLTSLEAWTSEPGLQLYDGYKLDVPVAGLGGRRYAANAGLCLEPQHFPDSPNQPHFPNAILAPGCTYHQTTEYRLLAARGDTPSWSTSQS
jgi:aldose 1-epimerase